MARAMPRTGWRPAFAAGVDTAMSQAAPMTLPNEYRTASQDFDRYIEALRAITMIESRNALYTMTQGVFQVFRRRVCIADALAFADALPPVLRAIFVADWRTDEPRAPFASREAMSAEAQTLRPHHNFATDTAIADVARALRAVVNEQDFRHALRKLPPDAAAFWDAG